jgi:iron complex transport system permease protein
MTRTVVLVAIGVLVAAAALLFSVLTGSSGFGWPESDTGWRIALELRLPRAIAALVTGGLLALAGVLMQVLLRNPLADPYILGLSGGAAAFVLGGMSFGLAAVLPTGLLAFAGALFSMLVVFVLGRGEGPWSTTRLLLTGVVIAAGWGALISLMLALGDDASLKGMLYWLMGDLGYSQLSPWWLLALAGLTSVLALRARSLNVLAAGETQAALLGESPKHRHAEIYIAASLLTALAVAIAGTVGFVGLIVPHLVRLLVGADHRRLIPISALAGSVFLLLADTLARTVIAPRQLPVGVLTALLGVPLFLLLLRRTGGLR